MEGAPRLLVIGRAREDAQRLLADCDVEVHVEHLDRETELPAAEVALVQEATPQLASSVYRSGARMVLVAHGASALREALIAANRDRIAMRSHDALEMLFNIAPMGVALLDRRGLVERANNVLAELLGRPAEALSGHRLIEFEDVPVAETVDDLRRSLVDRTDSHRRLEVRYRRPDGGVVAALETLARVERDGDYSIALVEDATARAAMEATVDTSERLRALIYLNVADVIFYLGIEGERFRFLEVNRVFLRATGLSESQVVGKFVDEVIPEPSLSLVLTKYREAIRERRTVRWDEVTDYPSGKKYGEVSVTPMIDAQGTCRSLVGTVHDVTDARRQEETIRLYADIVRAVQIGLTVWSVDDPRDPATIRLTAINPAAERATGVELGKRTGERLVDIFPETRGSELVDLVLDVARSEHMREVQGIRFGGAKHGRVFTVKGFPLPAKCVGLALEDVTTETRSRMLNELEQRVLEMAAAGEPLESTLTELVRAIEELAKPSIGSVLLLTPDGKHVRHGAAPNLPEEYNRVIDGAPIGPRAGSCGTAAFLKRSVVVTDIATDPLWEHYKDVALPHGLRACWSTPIIASDGRVLGTFALYYREPRSPTTDDLALISRANHVAGIAIQRHELDEQLRGLAARLEATREEERTAIARDIHDELGQMLTALKMDVAWIDRRAKSTEGIAPGALRDKLKEVAQMTDTILGEVRRIASELRPGILDDLGLTAALSWQGEQFERRTGIACTVDAAVDDRHLGRDVATAVFRVFQEALTNVVRHADATHVDVTFGERDGQLILEVRDDGKSIRAEDLHNPRSLGLLGMRERARRLGGTATFARNEPTGTIVTLRLPRAAEPSR